MRWSVDKIKTSFWNISIKKKFMIFYIVIVAALISITFIFNLVSTNIIVKKAVKQSTRETLLIADLLDNFFFDAKSYSKQLAIDETIQDYLVKYAHSSSEQERTKIRMELSKRISAYMIAKPILSDMCILDKNAAVVFADKVTDSATRLLVEEMELQGVPIEPTFTNLIEIQLKNEMVPGVALLKSVIRSDYGDKVGVVVFYISEDSIAKKYLATDSYIGEFTVVNEAGYVISSSQEELLFRNVGSEELSAIFPSYDTAKIIRNEKGEKQIVSVATMPRMGWQVVNHVPLAQVTQENVKMTWLLIGLAMLFVVLAVIENYIISKTVIMPILGLKTVMESAADEKNMALRAKVKSQDEVGMLSLRFNNMMDKIDALIRENNQQQQFARQYEVRLLQAQVNPHFLYNTLETIIMLTGLGMKEESMKATQDLADFYRLTLSHGAEMIPIKDEIALTDSYLAIQSYRYVEYMTYEMDVSEDLYQYTIPKLTIQPLVENAIYHGIKEKGGGKIKIHGYLDNGEIVISIWDSGVGMNQQKIDQLLRMQKLEKGCDSFGIISVNTKIKLTYGAEYGLQIHSCQGEYTEVTLRIPQAKV